MKEFGLIVLCAILLAETFALVDMNVEHSKEIAIYQKLAIEHGAAAQDELGHFYWLKEKH